MIHRLPIFAAYIFSFLILVGAGGLPTWNSGGSSSSYGSSSSSGYSDSGNNSIINPLNALELKNGLNMIQSLVYGKKYKKAEKSENRKSDLADSVKNLKKYNRFWKKSKSIVFFEINQN